MRQEPICATPFPDFGKVAGNGQSVAPPGLETLNPEKTKVVGAGGFASRTLQRAVFHAQPALNMRFCEFAAPTQNDGK